jgi:hypothetical protein
LAIHLPNAVAFSSSSACCATRPLPTPVLL